MSQAQLILRIREKLESWGYPDDCSVGPEGHDGPIWDLLQLLDQAQAALVVRGYGRDPDPLTGHGPQDGDTRWKR
jgi:hypothetical protein